MDIDEMKDWTSAISDNKNLPNEMTAVGKQTVLDGLQEAVNDPRVNLNFGPREYQLIDTLAGQLGGSVTRSNQNTPQGQGQQQGQQQQQQQPGSKRRLPSSRGNRLSIKRRNRP